MHQAADGPSPAENRKILDLGASSGLGRGGRVAHPLPGWALMRVSMLALALLPLACQPPPKAAPEELPKEQPAQTAISAVSPFVVRHGDVLTIRGDGFLSSGSNAYAVIGGTEVVEYLSRTNTELRVRVPRAARVGPRIPLRVTYEGGELETTVNVAALSVVAAGYYHNVAVREDGSTAVWGSCLADCAGLPVVTGVVAVAAGWHHDLALKADGTVVAWRSNAQGEYAVPAGLADVVAISAGNEHSLALKSDGSVVGWGANESGQATVPDGLADVVAISAGNGQSLALKSDGSVVGWGAGRPTPPAGMSELVSIAAGGHDLAIRASGSLVVWGDSTYPQAQTPPSGSSDVKAISVGSNHNLALRLDGTVLAWGADYDRQNTVPPGLAQVTAISAGANHNLALKSDGSVVTWPEVSLGTQAPADLLVRQP